MSMNSEVKALWVEALRSGKYSQTKEVLKDENGFCCLGVLCDIHSETQFGSRWKAVESVNKYGGEQSVAPTAVVKWLGILDCNPDVVIQGSTVNIAEINDSGYSFNEIADIIEQQL